MLLIGLVQSFEENLRVCKVELLWRLSCGGLEPRQNVLSPLSLLFILQVVNRRSKEEPDSVGKEEVNFAGAAQDLTDLFRLETVELWVQVEGAKLGDKELEV